MPNPLPSNDIGTRAFSGARASFYFNGTKVAYASGCDGSREIQYEPVETIDHLAVREHVPVGYRVNFNANIFRTVASGASTDLAPGSITQQGIYPEYGDNGSKILKMTGVVVFIQDRNTGKVLYLIQDVKPASSNFNITARGVVATNMSFVATVMLDEAEIK